jgi:hypothetical protein
MKITVKPKWPYATVAAHVDYLVANTLKALSDVPMHGRRRKHIERNLADLARLAKSGSCPIHTDDQSRFVNRRLNKLPA